MTAQRKRGTGAIKGSRMPKPAAETKVAFEALVPDAPNVAIRPMFGNLAAFVNGNMFMGLFGDDLFVRLSKGDREALLEAGGTEFSPMPGRPMREYVALPRTWRSRTKGTEEWVARSLAWASELPRKAGKRA